MLATLGIIQSNAKFTGLLDTYSGAAAAYSLRKLRNAYSGSAIRVRRSSDNIEQDIGFDGNGNLNESALTSFVGANSGYVTKWYDQSGNSIDGVQTTLVYQPAIVLNGAIQKLNNKPSAFYGASYNMTLGSTASYWKSIADGSNSFICGVISAGTVTNPDTYYVLLDNGYQENLGSGARFAIGFDDRSQFSRNNILNFDSYNYPNASYIVRNLVNDKFLPNRQNLFSYRINLNNATAANRAILNVNGGTDVAGNTNTGAVDTNTPTTNMILGKTANLNSGWVGYIQELIIYFSNQSSSRTGIESNINSYYSIY